MRWYIVKKSIGFKSAIQGVIAQLSKTDHSRVEDGFKEPVLLAFGQKDK